MVAEIFRYDCSHIMLSLNDDDDDAKALPTGVPKDDAMKKGGWGVKMSPKVMTYYLYVPSCFNTYQDSFSKIVFSTHILLSFAHGYQFLHFI